MYTSIPMMVEDDTTIRVSRSTWQQLHDRKDPGQSHDGVIQELLNNVGVPESGEIPEKT